MTQALASLRNDKQLQGDLAKLERACCMPQKLALPEGAPRLVLMGSLAKTSSRAAR